MDGEITRNEVIIYQIALYKNNKEILTILMTD